MKIQQFALLPHRGLLPIQISKPGQGKFLSMRKQIKAHCNQVQEVALTLRHLGSQVKSCQGREQRWFQIPVLPDTSSVSISLCFPTSA